MAQPFVNVSQFNAAVRKLVEASYEQAETAGLPEPTTADLVMLAIKTIDIDTDEDAAYCALFSLLWRGDFAEAINGRL